VYQQNRARCKEPKIKIKAPERQLETLRQPYRTGRQQNTLGKQRVGTPLNKIKSHLKKSFQIDNLPKTFCKQHNKLLILLKIHFEI
jgi:hypothetical protein